ncbi:MAG: SLC13 family permease [Puniceicoccaceae bacterium]|nr:MAG: SLC13 family permease [Puniceicoccaceae bacterium]
MSEAHLVFILLALTLAGFVWGRVRYDVVALLALIASVLLGLVPAEDAFSGFGHPAVITVIAVLVLSRSFQHSGLVDAIAAQTLKAGGNPIVQTLVLAGAVALLSAFMNNVGALALMLPVAIRMARENNTPPSLLLMPLAFGSLLGGLMTLIGTPPNIIVSTMRADRTGEAFGMFSFLPVGGVVMLAGVTFLALLGWRLTPKRKGQASPDEVFETADYLGELEVGEDSKAVGWSLRELDEACKEPMPVVAVVRKEKRIPTHRFRGTLQAGDILIVEADPEELKLLESKGGLTVGKADFSEQFSEAKDLEIAEAVVTPGSRLVSRTTGQVRLFDRHGVHLLAVARGGSRLKQRLSKIRFQAGDVLLVQGDESELAEGLAEIGCLPLARRNLSIGKPRRLILSVALFAAAIVVMLLGWLPASVALIAAAVLTVLTGVLPLREAYAGIDWPVIVLLGAMIPVGQSLETSGGSAMVAELLLVFGTDWPVVVTLALLFIITMGLSGIINNAAAAVLMTPIAFSLADGFAVSADPFLMAVAVSASCAFLTPIGHQSNTLVMGPGGYRFGDYAILGTPLTLLVIVVAIPMILLVWPL